MTEMRENVQVATSVYRSLTDVRLLAEGDSLNGEEVLPGFSVSIASLFAN